MRSTSKSEIMKQLKEAIKSKKIDITKGELAELISLYDSKTIYEQYKREAERPDKSQPVCELTGCSQNTLPSMGLPGRSRFFPHRYSIV